MVVHFALKNCCVGSLLNIYADIYPVVLMDLKLFIHYQSFVELPSHMLWSVRALELIVPQATTNSS